MSAVLDNPAKFDTLPLAERYDRISNSQFENGVLLIKELGVKEGDYVLDIGCGTGRLSEYVLEKIGKYGYILGLDPSGHRIRIAQQRIKSFSNVNFGVGTDRDLHRFADESFNVVYFNSVFHHIADKPAALAQIYRLLKPGGRLGIADPAKEPRGILRTVTREILRSYGRPGSFNDEPFTAEELRSLIVSAGFQILKLNQIKNTRYYATPLQVIEFIEASDFGNYLSGVPENLRGKVKADIAAKLGEYQTEKGLELTGYTNYAIAQKSARVHS